MLQEGVGDHRHEGMPVQAVPGSSLEVVETEFLLELLMGLFTNPSALIVAARSRSLILGERLAR